MRDFRDAKVMAHSLRDALKTKAMEITHSESLELIAKAFGYENWNILSAKIEATEPAASSDASSEEPSLSVAYSRAPAPPPKTLYCSFCGKSQHEVRKLIAGPIHPPPAPSGNGERINLSPHPRHWRTGRQGWHRSFPFADREVLSCAISAMQRSWRIPCAMP